MRTCDRCYRVPAVVRVVYGVNAADGSPCRYQQRVEHRCDLCLGTLRERTARAVATGVMHLSVSSLNAGSPAAVSPDMNEKARGDQ